MQGEEKINAHLHNAQQDLPAKQIFLISIVYAFLTPQIPDENTRPIIYSQNILKKIVYSKISCDNTEFSSELEKRDLTEAFKNSLFLKKHSNPEVQSPC